MGFDCRCTIGISNNGVRLYLKEATPDFFALKILSEDFIGKRIDHLLRNAARAWFFDALRYLKKHGGIISSLVEIDGFFCRDLSFNEQGNTIECRLVPILRFKDLEDVFSAQHVRLISDNLLFRSFFTSALLERVNGKYLLRAAGDWLLGISSLKVGDSIDSVFENLYALCSTQLLDLAVKRDTIIVNFGEACYSKALRRTYYFHFSITPISGSSFLTLSLFSLPPSLFFYTMSAVQTENNTFKILSQRLTKREYEIAICIIRGESNRFIAAKCGISEGTVKKTLSNIYSKLGINKRVDLVNLTARQ